VKLKFKSFIETTEFFEAKKDLANYLVESNVDLQQFNKGLSILAEWDFNPLKTMAQSGAAGAGAVAGSAFGPVGTALGGLAGRAIGKGVSNVAGKFFGKSRVQPIQPIYQQAIQAVNSLSQILNDPKSQNIGNVQSINQNLQKVQSDLKNMGNSIPEIDKQRNATLDAELKSGGGWGEKLRGATGNDGVSKAMNFIGNKIQNIPALNQDQGLRRAMSKGMDALQNWSKENPQKAAMLNMGAAGLGAVGGAMTANQFSGLGQGEPQQSFKKDNQIANNNSGNQIANQSPQGYSADDLASTNHPVEKDALGRTKAWKPTAASSPENHLSNWQQDSNGKWTNNASFTKQQGSYYQNGQEQKFDRYGNPEGGSYNKDGSSWTSKNAGSFFQNK